MGLTEVNWEVKRGWSYSRCSPAHKLSTKAQAVGREHAHTWQGHAEECEERAALHLSGSMCRHTVASWCCEQAS